MKGNQFSNEQIVQIIQQAERDEQMIEETRRLGATAPLGKAPQACASAGASAMYLAGGEPGKLGLLLKLVDGASRRMQEMDEGQYRVVNMRKGVSTPSQADQNAV